MSDLIDDPAPGQNMPEFTVSEISGAVKRTLEDQFGRIRVKGEVGRVFKARSGHLYYDVKDDRNVLACTTWKGQISKLSVVPEEGLEVVVTGRLTAFGAQSKYNMNVDEVAVAGQGALMALLEKRKTQLAAEGLFAPERKTPLPYLPEIIGVITSPSGAVIRDILHRLRDRFPRKVLIWPVAVQGKQCAPEVENAIKGFNAFTKGGALPRPDLLIVARGGGSVEDLWGFNEENVARAAAASEIPLISAVGHETDTTLIDYVSDQRAPTPTAAAELAVPVRLDLLAWVEGQGARLTRSASMAVGQRRQRLADLSRALPQPETLLDTARQRLDRAAHRLPGALERMVQRRRVALAEQAAHLRPSSLRQSVQRKADQLNALSRRLTPRPLQAQLTRQSDALTTLSRRLSPRPLEQQIERQRAALNALDQRLTHAARMQIFTLKQDLAAKERLLKTLSYQSTLERGYVVVRADDALITRKGDVADKQSLELEFADGRISVSPNAPSASGPGGPRKTARKSPPPPEQGSLFDG